MFIIAMSWLSAGIGLLARSPEAASAFTFFVIFLPYPSSSFVPIDTMPTWMQGFATDQPFTPIIESVRGLLIGQEVGSNAAAALVWSGGIPVISIALCIVIFRRTR